MHPQPTSCSSDRSNTVFQKDRHDGCSFGPSLQLEDDFCDDFVSNTADVDFGQPGYSLDYVGGFGGVLSSFPASLSRSSQIYLENQSPFSALTSTELPSAAVSYDVTPPSLITGTSQCYLTSAKKPNFGTPSVTIENRPVNWPSVSHHPLDSVAYEWSDTSSKPVSLPEASPVPTRVQDFHMEMCPIPPTNSSYADAQCTFQSVAPQAAQDFISGGTQISEASSHPTIQNEGHDTCFPSIFPNQVPYSAYGQSRSHDESASKMRRRERNSISARKYRQKRLDRIAELEQALAKTEKERDSLAVQLECWKTKAELLQELTLGSKGGGCTRKGSKAGDC